MDKPFIQLVCPEHRTPLALDEAEGDYRCLSGCSFRALDGIHRFVSDQGYAASFGLQWKIFRTTQLDSFTGTTISRDRLTRLLGGDLEILRNKTVLEAGCGAGRFTEILLDSGARVFAVDISSAVEANLLNFRERPDYFVCQADLNRLPLQPEQFDVVICIGVVQHTPDPEATIRVLSTHVKTGGTLVVDHYTYGYEVTASRRLLRRFLLRMQPSFAFAACRILVSFLWPIHTILWRYKDIALVRRIRSYFLRFSPLVDYHDSYAQIGPNLLRDWALLDTHDTLTDVYKHLRGADEIEKCFKECGLTEIHIALAGNGVEARGRKVYPNTKSDLRNESS